jgi:hypothetical protein
MRRIIYSTMLLFLSLFTYGQKKFFFDHIEMTLNFHVGDASIQKESWPGLFKKTPSAYAVDTFYNIQLGRKCIIFPFIPTSLSAGLRFSKYLFKGSGHRLVKERVEWRTGFLVGTATESSSFLTNYNYNQPPPAGEYFYKELSLHYRRRWVDINNHLVYKIPSWLFRKNLKYYVGGGAGLTGEISSRISENLVQYRAAPAGSGYTITEESKTTKNEKAKTVISPYFSFTCGSEIKCSESWYILLEATSQSYTNSFSQKKSLYKEGGFLSLILRYKF